MIITAIFTTQALAEDPAPTPAVLQQIVMSEQLITLGKERGDAILILAGIRLRANLDEGALPTVDATLTDRDAAFAAATEAASSDPALVEIVKDVEAAGSRRMRICTYNTYGSNYCY
ncbi:MAG: hypothetical protein AAGG69_00245 [Pseudomonadota bacterium]